MYSGFQRFGSLGMSTPQLFLVQEDENDTRFKTLLKDASELRDGPDEIAPGGPEFQEKNIDIDADKKEEKCTDESSVSSTESQKQPSLGQSEVTDEDEGFRTPTSPDHKIPQITQCPPAPKKVRPKPSTKRKVTSSRIRRSLQLDLSSEVELMFPPTVQDDLRRKIKKARTEDSS